MTRLALAFALLAAPAAAQNCISREDVLDQLANKYEESRQAIGLTASGELMELLGNAETGTWTIAVTRPDGRTCIYGYGQGFERLKPTKTGKKL